MMCGYRDTGAAGCGWLRWVAVGLTVISLPGCGSVSGWLSASGPSREQVQKNQQGGASAIRLIGIDSGVARRVRDAEKTSLFSESLAATGRSGLTVGPGDMLEVSVWEAPPAALFGITVLDPKSGPATSRSSTLPEQMVSAEGTINVPFAGMIQVDGKSLHQIEEEIVHRLTGKANQPQVLVRITRNATSNVTVVGEVTQSLRVPLTAKGEHLLDAIAAAGGVRQPVNKVTVQITRGAQVQSLPFEEVIQSPKENVALAPGDVVTVLYQPLSFTVLGATGKNEEINFEAKGISLAQALARAGGVQDARADARGVFIFRFEDPQALADSGKGLPTTPEGKVPVVYRADLKEPSTFLVAQGFPIRNKDVMYVANAPAAELQKFLNILSTTIYSLSGLTAIQLP